ncbi:MAG TPA: hypothetical protein VMV04_25035 [Thermodesulfobacteriota bacterium]|nr:hypothetical protein [Thermodesulfobacteriota bacterium]
MRITTREQAIEDLSTLGIKEPHIYLVDIIPLIEMIWADGEAHESELAVLDEYLHKRVQQINEMAGYQVMDFEEAQAFANQFIQQRPSPEFLAKLRSLVGPILLSSSDSHYDDSLLKLLIEACIDIAANAVRKYPYGLHDRFDSEEKRCFFEILKTFIDYARPERTKEK